MSVQKFKPIVWAKQFESELDKKLVAYECTNHQHEGLAREPGDSIKILGLGEVDTHRWSDGKLHQLPAPQEIMSNSQTMPINQVEYFRFFVGDLDKAQSVNGGQLLSQYMSDAKDKVAEAQDSYILKLASESVNVVDTITITQSSKTGADKALMKALDNGLLHLLENNVSRETDMYAITPPRFNVILKNEYTDIDTNNSTMLRNGTVGVYSSIGIKESNNLYQDDQGFYYCPVMTTKAISFVKPYIHLESQRASDYFQDEVKGYSLFDGKITRDHEIGIIKVKFA